MVQIKRIGVKQTAKVIAFFYFLISLVFVFPMALIAFVASLFTGGSKWGALPVAFGGLLFLALPFLYALMGYFLIAVMASIYNFIAKTIGGIEVEIDSESSSKTGLTKSTKDK